MRTKLANSEKYLKLVKTNCYRRTIFLLSKLVYYTHKDLKNEMPNTFLFIDCLFVFSSKRDKNLSIFSSLLLCIEKKRINLCTIFFLI